MTLTNTSIEVRLTFKRETKGAILYEEVDQTGGKAHYSEQKLGNLYIRKSSFPNNKAPTHIRVIVNYEV